MYLNLREKLCNFQTFSKETVNCIMRLSFILLHLVVKIYISTVLLLSKK